MNDNPAHDVYMDRAGWRFACRTCDATLNRRPFMSPAVWNGRLSEFKEKHPFTVAKHYPGEG